MEMDIAGTPTIIFIDKNKNETGKIIGPFTKEMLNKATRDLSGKDCL
jgi:hypothetical protein